MSLNGALNIGAQALAVQQAAIQVTGNNISNAGNADFTRQVVSLSANPDQQVRAGVFIGQGVNLDSVSRQIDESLQSRIRAATSDSSQADTSSQWLGQVEGVFNALGSNNVSTQLGKFFGSWSTLANQPQDAAQRQVVIQNGQSVAKSFTDLRNQLTTLQADAGRSLPSLVKNADAIAGQIASLNGQIATAEGGGTGTDNGLRDQRDAALNQLSKLVDVQAVPQNNGTLNVYIGSEPVVYGTTNNGLTLTNNTVNGVTTQSVAMKSNGGTVAVTSGQIGALLSTNQGLTNTIGKVDSLAQNLIFELNKIHSSGQGLSGFGTTTSTNAVADPTVALNDPKSGLTTPPSNGSFVIHVTDKATGLSSSSLVQIDLSPASGAGTTLNSLATTLSAIPGVTATVNGGKLTIAAANSGSQVSFSQDSSGVLASLGVNSFFTGKDASDIAVNQTLVSDPTQLAAAKNGQPGDNQTARAIAALQGQPLAALNGTSLNDSYNALVTGVGESVSTAKNDADAAKSVVDTLQGQRQTLSGVSLDEEAVNLMQQQRAYQAAARLISTVNQLMDVTLQLVH